MSRCVVADVGDGLACTVHCHYEPCPHDGQPANTAPLHATPGAGGMDELLAYWHTVCGGRRPLIVHRPPFEGTHALTAAGACWCLPQRIEPDRRPQ